MNTVYSNICFILAVTWCLCCAKVVDKREASLDALHDDLPKEEFSQFWNQLRTSLGEERGTEFAKKLQENEGNMDLTLTQFKPHLDKDYPAISSAWEGVKTKWTALRGSLSEITLGEIYNWVKGKVQTMLANQGGEGGTGLFDMAKGYLMSFFHRVKDALIG